MKVYQGKRGGRYILRKGRRKYLPRSTQVGLGDMPPEMLAEIAKRVDIPDLGQMAQTSKQLRRIAADPIIKKSVYQRSEKNKEFIDSINKNDFTKFKRLLLLVDTGTSDNLAIRQATGQGQTEMVRLLLRDPRVDPTVQNNLPIQLASLH
jgi:hypothetical protein